MNVGVILKKRGFCKRIEQFHISMRKQILSIKNFANNIEVLSELAEHYESRYRNKNI